MSKVSSSYVKISEKLYLTEYNVVEEEKKKKPEKREAVNHIWIYDRSGSMYGLLSRLIDDLIVRVKNIPVGDTITIGYFSSEGQRNFILKGFKVTEERDYTLLEKALRTNSSTLGCTCFSEILHDTKQVVEDLQIFSSKFALCFFTDGYPVVSNYSKEITEIHKAVEGLSSKVTASLLVGYGDYYNKSLMAEMAEKIGGSLTHSANLPSFSISLDAFLGTAQESKRVTVPLKTEVTKDTTVFNVNGTNINLYSAEDGEVKVSCGDEDIISVYVLSDAKPKGSSVSKKSVDDYEKILYAAALILSQKTKVDLAIDVLGCLGDKKLIDILNNSFTNAEYGVAEEAIKGAMLDEAKRYEDGKVAGYVPAADVFCFLDLIDLLAEDKDAFFYPRHEAFDYKRIGKPSTVDEKYPKFEGKKDTKTSFSDVVWNESKLNLSLRAYISGTIKLTEAKNYGLLEDYPTFQWRNYTFVKDGILNITRLPVTLSKKTYTTLVSKGLIDTSVLPKTATGNLKAWNKDTIYFLLLDKVPIVNRKIAEGKTSAADLCLNVLTEQKLKAILKAIKHFKEQDYPEKELTIETAKTFIEKQQAFLESVGINTKTGAYEPPMIESEASDFYLAKEFAIKVKGLSSLPKIEVVAEKMKENKKLTASDTLVSDGIAVYQKEGKPTLDWFINTISDYNVELRKVRRQIQETKFAVLLCKKWFDEFTSREENKLLVNGYEVTISLSEKRVAI